MQIELTIKADRLEDIAHIFTRAAVLDRAEPAQTLSGPRETTKEVEPEATVGKPVGRGRTKKAAADTATGEVGSTATPTSDTATAGTTEATSTSDAEPVTFEDLHTKTSALLDSGKVDSRAVQQMLKDKFSVPAFGGLKPEQYADCMAELENIG